MSKKLKLSVALTLLVASSSAIAATPAENLVSNLSHGQIKTVRSFPGPAGSGLTGVIAVTPQGSKGILWVLDNKYAVTGTLLTSTGTSLSSVYAKEQGLVANSSAVALKMLKAPGFVWGTGGPLIAAFLDPNCIFCHKLYGEIAPLVNAGKLRVKIVPVGFLKADSLAKATTIMMSANPSKEWAYSEAHYNVAAEEGGVVPVKALSQKVENEIKGNTALLESTGELATPTVVSCRGGQETTWKGLPVSINSGNFLTGLTSLNNNGTCS